MQGSLGDENLNVEQETFLEATTDEDSFLQDVSDTDEELESSVILLSEKARRTARKPGFSEEALRAALANAVLAEATPYSMYSSFSVNELIFHDRFGLGLVAEILGPKKMRVVFQEGTKILVKQYTHRKTG